MQHSHSSKVTGIIFLNLFNILKPIPKSSLIVYITLRFCANQRQSKQCNKKMNAKKKGINRVTVSVSKDASRFFKA